MKTLITAGTTSSAFSIARLLGPAVSSIFGDNGDFPVPGIPGNRLITLPRPSDKTFEHEMLTICLDNEITRILPLRRDELSALANSKQLFAEFGISIILPSGGTIAVSPTQSKTIVIVQDHTIVGVSKEQVPAAPLPEEGIFYFSAENGYSIFAAD